MLHELIESIWKEFCALNPSHFIEDWFFWGLRISITHLTTLYKRGRGCSLWLHPFLNILRSNPCWYSLTSLSWPRLLFYFDLDKSYINNFATLFPLEIFHISCLKHIWPLLAVDLQQLKSMKKLYFKTTYVEINFCKTSLLTLICLAYQGGMCWQQT